MFFRNIFYLTAILWIVDSDIMIDKESVSTKIQTIPTLHRYKISGRSTKSNPSFATTLQSDFKNILLQDSQLKFQSYYYCGGGVKCTQTIP